jgi:hypothetical protein
MKGARDWTRWHWAGIFAGLALALYLFTFWRVLSGF